MARPVFIPVVFYRDPIAALKWLERTFGFETTILVTDGEGKVAHSEMAFRGGVVSVGGEWSGGPLGPARMRSPASLDGIGTQFLRITLADGLDEHCSAARSAGAQIVDEPADQPYGARTYRALDLEGHVWNFTQDVAVVSGEDMEAATGLRIHTSLAGV